jgi:outer membrane lipoprotein carrier protein
MRLRLALILATGLFALPGLDNAEQVASLLKRFEGTYRSSRTLRADFLERYFDNGREVRAESGIAYFAKPGRMRWEYIAPESNLYLVDGKWSWFYVPADHTVTRIRAKESGDARTPLALLAGEVRLSRICKGVNAEQRVHASNPNGVVLRCTLRGSDEIAASESNVRAKTSASRSSYASFELDRENGQLLRVVVVDPGGVQVEFQFKNWAFDPPLEDAKFHFSPPKGVAIVDGSLGASDRNDSQRAR